MKRSLWGKAIRLSALVLAIAVGTAGCVEPDPPSVAIAKKKASLVFGVTVNEPVQPITEQLPTLDELQELDASDLEADFEELDLAPPVAVKPKEECPKAEITAVADAIATNNVSGPAPMGRYRWVRGGFVQNGNVQLPFTGFETRSISEYTKVSDTIHQFKFTYRVPSGPLAVVDTYRVRTNGTVIGTTDIGNAPMPVTGPRIGENDRGLMLVQRRTIDNKGAVVAEFTPSTPLLMLPLPVSPGEEWTSVAVDNKSGQTIIHRGKTIGTKRIDACGEVVDGWGVESSQTYTSSAGAAEVLYDYTVAPQYGAMFLSERFRQTVGAVNVDISYTLGQVRPSAGS